MLRTYKAAALTAEFVGTFTLTSVVLGMLDRGQPFFATVLLAGITLALVVLGVGRVSGAHINPAVTIGLWSIRKVETSRAIAYLFVQFAGAYAALVVAEQLFDTDLLRRATAVVDWRVTLAEALGATIFTMGIAAAIYRGYRGLLAAATVGGSLTLGLVIASLGSGAVVNPAVALGINSFSLSYVLGPILGAVLGMNVYAALFAPLDIAERRRALGLSPVNPASSKPSSKSSKPVAKVAVKLSTSRATKPTTKTSTAKKTAKK